jgi:hypothetical protein
MVAFLDMRLIDSHAASHGTTTVVDVLKSEEEKNMRK